MKDSQIAPKTSMNHEESGQTTQMKSMAPPPFQLAASSNDGGGIGSVLKAKGQDEGRTDKGAPITGDYKVNSPVKTRELLMALNSGKTQAELIEIWACFFNSYKDQKMPDSLEESKLPADFIRVKFGENVIETLSDSKTHFSITGTMLDKEYQYSKDFHNNLLIWTSDLPVAANLARVKDLLDEEAWQVINYRTPKPRSFDPEHEQKTQNLDGTPIPPDPGWKHQYDAKKPNQMAKFLETDQGVRWQDVTFVTGVDKWQTELRFEKEDYVLFLDDKKQLEYLKSQPKNKAFFNANPKPEDDR